MDAGTPVFLDFNQLKPSNRYLTHQATGRTDPMHRIRIIASLALSFLLLFGATGASSAQSRPQKNERPAGEGKKNQRPTAEDIKKAEEERKRQEEEKNAIVDPTVEKIETNEVDVDAVVLNKKTGQIITGLKKENFAVF